MFISADLFSCWVHFRLTGDIRLEYQPSEDKSKRENDLGGFYLLRHTIQMSLLYEGLNRDRAMEAPFIHYV